MRRCTTWSAPSVGNGGWACAQAAGAHASNTTIAATAAGWMTGIDAAWKDKVLHARIELGGTAIYGADIPSPPFEPVRSAYLSLSVASIAEAERVYALLSEGGEIFMKMEETFFADRFAMFRDRFGTLWMLLHEKPMPANATTKRFLQ